MRSDAVLTLHTSRIRHARPAHRAEELVVRTLWEHTMPALSLPAAATLNTAAHNSRGQMTARISDSEVAHGAAGPITGSGQRHLS